MNATFNKWIRLFSPFLITALICFSIAVYFFVRSPKGSGEDWGQIAAVVALFWMMVLLIVDRIVRLFMKHKTTSFFWIAELIILLLMILGIYLWNK